MTFRSFVIMMMYSRWTKRWESNPDAVGTYLFGDDFQDRREEVGRGEAERKRRRARR